MSKLWATPASNNQGGHRARMGTEVENLPFTIEIPRSPSSLRRRRRGLSDSRRPKTDAAYDKLHRLLWIGELKHERDLSPHVLADRWQLSRTTLTRALDELVEDGFLIAESGKYRRPIPTAQQIQQAYARELEIIQEALAISRKLGPTPRVVRAASAPMQGNVAPPDDPLALADDVEQLLRRAVGRSQDELLLDQLESNLFILSLPRRVESTIIRNASAEIRTLRTYFQLARYDDFLRKLAAYTERRREEQVAFALSAKALLSAPTLQRSQAE